MDSFERTVPISVALVMAWIALIQFGVIDRFAWKIATFLDKSRRVYHYNDVAEAWRKHEQRLDSLGSRPMEEIEDELGWGEFTYDSSARGIRGHVASRFFRRSRRIDRIVERRTKLAK